MLFTIGLAGMVCAGLYLDGSIGRKIMRAIVLACAWMYAFWALLVFGSFAQMAGEKYVTAIRIGSDPTSQRSNIRNELTRWKPKTGTIWAHEMPK